jgi:hypothetical protein
MWFSGAHTSLWRQRIAEADGRQFATRRSAHRYLAPVVERRVAGRVQRVLGLLAACLVSRITQHPVPPCWISITHSRGVGMPLSRAWMTPGWSATLK